MTETTGTTGITAIRTVGITVADQDRALAFYRDVLGFEVRLDAPFGQNRWIEVAPPGAATSLALVARGGAPAAGVDTGIRLAAADARVAHAALLARDVDADPDVTLWPSVPPMFTFRDPDGNVLVVVEAS
jgi:catechol 2,3-dioxygenase-like lactoylglutathione lyase family enzyme